MSYQFIPNGQRQTGNNADCLKSDSVTFYNSPDMNSSIEGGCCHHKMEMIPNRWKLMNNKGYILQWLIQLSLRKPVGLE